MVEVSIQKPTDQPTGEWRLLEELRANLADDGFDKFRLVVAFVTVGPLLRLEDRIIEWKEAGKEIEAVIGVDEGITSEEALRFALEQFHETFVASADGAGLSTFHPKVYLFEGPDRAVAYVGSNNLTVGGTETNLETFLKIEMVLPDDQATLDELRQT